MANPKDKDSMEGSSEDSTPTKELLGQNSEEDDEEEVAPTPTLDAGGRVNKKFCVDLIQYYKQQRRLPTQTALKILRDAKQLLMTHPSLVEINLGKDDVVNICGDIHGQFFDLARIFHLYGMPSERNQFLFNGDFVDRGPWSCEVLFLLLSLKLLHPNHFFLARGNHEAEEVNRVYGFRAEVLDKYDARVFQAAQEVFNWLPLAHLVNGRVLAMHGGLSCEDGVTLDDIRSIKRGCQPCRTGLMCDLLWSDPQEDLGRFPNHRGFSCVFGPDVTNRFLRENNLLYIVRSHECVQYGYDLCHDDKVVTVFSAPNYCGRYGNKGAICTLHGDDVSMPEFRRFDAAEHPVADKKYYDRILVRMNKLSRLGIL